MHLDFHFVGELTASLFPVSVSFKSSSVYFDGCDHIVLVNFKRISTQNPSTQLCILLASWCTSLLEVAFVWLV